jgi:hypothetical protein
VLVQRSVRPLSAEPPRALWRVEPDEIPPELAGNSFVQFLTTLTPEDAALFDHLAERDRREYLAERKEPGPSTASPMW